MLMLEEFKRNLKFFISMTLVLTLLMAAGVSLFNFSFEINRKIYESIEENFEYGYAVEVDEFMQPDDGLKANGVSYARYSWTVKKIAGVDESFFNPVVYSFEDYLPKNYVKAIEEVDGFLIAGSLWTSADNEQTDGKNPIFISDAIVLNALDLGVELKAGDTVNLCESIWSYVYDGEFITGEEYTDGVSRQFFIKGIYKSVPYISEAVISLNAELQYSQDFENRQEIESTRFIINSVDEYKKFSAYANKIGLEYYAGIEEEIGVANLFSVIFAVLSVVILSFCGLIAFVYCTMFINKRLNFIGLLKALGQSSFDISKQIFVLLIVVFGVSFLLANVFSVFMTTHFANLALSLFDYKLNTGFNILSQGVFGILVVVTALLSALLLNRRINKISIAQVLTQKE